MDTSVGLTGLGDAIRLSIAFRLLRKALRSSRAFC